MKGFNEDRYYSKNPIMNYYFNKFMNEGIKLIGNESFILDFGCGESVLKKKLLDKKIVGYDINPELSDVKDYKKLKPDVIFCSNVFEHLTKEKLRRTLKNFIKMKPRYLVTIQPNEWLLFKLGGKLFRRKVYEEHILQRHEVYEEVSKYFKLITNKPILLWTIHVAKWEIK